jgi:hypothetical protein
VTIKFIVLVLVNSTLQNCDRRLKTNIDLWNFINLTLKTSLSKITSQMKRTKNGLVLKDAKIRQKEYI